MDLRLRRRFVQFSVLVDGGYQITFAGCGHTAWFAVDPGRTAYCATCVDELTNAIRQGAEIGPVTPGEFLIAHAPKLADMQKDAQRLPAVVFRRKYGIKPNDYQRRVRALRELAARGDAGAADEVRSTMRILLVIWARAQQ
jgi:hypothetical protein